MSQKVHEYVTIGEFEATISNVKTFAASTSDYAWYTTISQNKYTFKNITNLNKAVTSIENNAFYGCSGLTSVMIPNSVTSISNKAFLELPQSDSNFRRSYSS